MQTAGDIVAYALQRIGRTEATLSAGHNIWDDLNAAGSQLFTAHDWPWRFSGPIALPVTAGQDFLLLPADFANLMEAWIPDVGIFNVLRSVSLSQYAQLRSLDAFGITAYALYIHWPAWEQGAAEDPPERRALLYPTPVTDGDPTIQLTYKRRWRRITRDDDKARPNVPQEWMLALAYQTTAVAHQREHDTVAVETELYQAEVQRLITEVSRTPGRYGLVEGGARTRLIATEQHTRFDRARPFISQL